MAEYIDKSELYKEIAELEELSRKRVVDTPTNSPAYARYVAQLNERTMLKHKIADTHAADVAPVVHGKWIPLWFDDEDKLFREAPSDYKCSACKAIVPAKQAIHENYCHICGAKMDGDR